MPASATSRAPLDRSRARASWDTLTASTELLVLNTDIDGLLSGALLSEQYPDWRICGFYDNEKLWISASGAVSLRRAPASVLWVDCSMCWPGLRSVSQHVVAVDDTDADLLETRAPHIGPSQLAGIGASTYRYKYPFGTFQFLWWLLRDSAVDHPLTDMQNGLMWMPDGGSGSLRHANPDIRRNCQEWVHVRLPGNPMRALATVPIVETDGVVPMRLAAQLASRIRKVYVQGAFDRLRSQCDLPDAAWDLGALQAKLSGYEKYQERSRPFEFIRHTDPYVNFEKPEDVQRVRRVLEVIATEFDWGTTTVDEPMRRFDGLRVEVGSRDGAALDGSWLQRADLEGWVSLAFTSDRDASFTRAGSEDNALRSVLPN